MWPVLLRLRPIVSEAWWQRIADLYWRRFFEKSGLEADAVSGSERAEFLQTIAGYYPFTSLLEVGCSYGQNFHLLARMFPKSQFTGIDIDSSRIEAGKNLLAEEGLGANVELMQRSAFDLTSFPDDSFDLVIASAALLYIDGDRIEGVVREMLRICRRSLILLEQHLPRAAFSDQHRGTFIPPEGTTPGYWLRDYEQLFRFAVPGASVKLRKVPGKWLTEQWVRLAHVIEVEKRRNNS